MKYFRIDEDALNEHMKSVGRTGQGRSEQPMQIVKFASSLVSNGKDADKKLATKLGNSGREFYALAVEQAQGGIVQ